MFLCCQLEKSCSQFNLYNTEESFLTNVFDHDCLYFEQSSTFGIHRSLTWFCIRPEIQKRSTSATEDKLCYGKRITFQELKLINISIIELFKWNAAIETIDQYEKYLLFPELSNENEFYCNCSLLSRFGKSCEYQFHYTLHASERLFSELFTQDIILAREEIIRLRHEISNQLRTSFIGISFQTKSLSLDRRQICNGIVDCDHGEDEPIDFCFQMELNECHPENEFRCKNGSRIPI